jgi:hypothetical protein
MVAHSDNLSDRFIFNFQIMVAGKMASARSVNELIAGNVQSEDNSGKHVLVEYGY